MMHDRPQREKKERLEIEDSIVNPYELLGLDRSASEAAIKSAYFAKVREYPPEREPLQFKRIRAAYDMLRTPAAKAATDLFLLQPPLAYEGYKRPPSFDLNFDATDKQRAAQAQTDLLRSDFRSDFRDIKL